jgi:hypothetical protein
MAVRCEVCTWLQLQTVTVLRDGQAHLSGSLSHVIMNILLWPLLMSIDRRVSMLSGNLCCLRLVQNCLYINGVLKVVVFKCQRIVIYYTARRNVNCLRAQSQAVRTKEQVTVQCWNSGILGSDLAHGILLHWTLSCHINFVISQLKVSIMESDTSKKSTLFKINTDLALQVFCETGDETWVL